MPPLESFTRMPPWFAKRITYLISLNLMNLWFYRRRCPMGQFSGKLFAETTGSYRIFSTLRFMSPYPRNDPRLSCRFRWRGRRSLQECYARQSSILSSQQNWTHSIFCSPKVLLPSQFLLSPGQTRCCSALIISRIFGKCCFSYR